MTPEPMPAASNSMMDSTADLGLPGVLCENPAMAPPDGGFLTPLATEYGHHLLRLLPSAESGEETYTAGVCSADLVAFCASRAQDCCSLTSVWPCFGFWQDVSMPGPGLLPSSSPFSTVFLRPIASLVGTSKRNKAAWLWDVLGLAS